MFRILVTLGGTVERIDDVRSIVNHSTGALGMEIAAAFLREGCEVTCITGAVGTTALGRPLMGSMGITEINITDVASLEKTILELCEKFEFDAIIHAMAVSDYRLKGGAKKGKLGSDAEEITLTLKRNPKIISMFRGLAPNAVLVGFKLTSGLSEEETISAGHALLVKNNCDFVLANDTANLTSEGHRGYLIQKEKTFEVFCGKAEIAANITRITLERLKK
jgi:phosphopantothenate-cysteine ligase